MSKLGITAFVREVLLPGGPDTVPKLLRRHCRFCLKAGPSSIHRWGIFAAERIPARRRVIEYTGQSIGLAEVVRRSIRPHLYIFHVSATRAIDGAIGGSGAEFINHGCDPCLYASISDGHIFLVSARRIEAGEELTYDYNVIGEGQPTRCLCGSPRCRGSLDRNPH